MSRAAAAPELRAALEADAIANYAADGPTVIARRHGVSKNVVIGIKNKHRYPVSNAPMHPPSDRQLPLRKPPKPDAPAPASSPKGPKPPVAPETVTAKARPRPIPRLKPLYAVLADASAAARAVRDVGHAQCRWPSDHHPNDPGFRFCCAPAAVGKPYCPEHLARAGSAYQRPGLAAAAQRVVSASTRAFA